MRFQLIAMRIVALFALAVSAAQLADDFLDKPAFCGFHGGCEDVTASDYGHPLGVPLAAVGVVGFGLLFGLTLAPDHVAFRLLRPCAVVGGCVGVALIAIQAAVIGQFCPLCLMVDTAAILLAVLAVVRRPPAAERAPLPRVWLAGWSTVGLLAVVLPPLWGVVQAPPPVPEQVKGYWTPGTVTVVEVMDFECPACRRAEPVMKEFLQAHPRVRYVRLPVPLISHPGARPAARAYLAAKAQGKGEELAPLLLADKELSPESCRRLAASTGVNLAEYDRVVNAKATDGELDGTLAWSEGTGVGLPLIYVQDQQVFGVPKPGALDAALAAAEADPTGKRR